MPSDPPAERLESLRSSFSPQVATLNGASRPIDDWISDNILRPFDGQLFPIKEAIELYAAQGYEFYHSSPDFVVNWRWYKDLVQVRRPGTNMRVSHTCVIY